MDLVVAHELNMGGYQIRSVAEPTVASDAATKNYVDTVAAVSAEFLVLTLTGTLPSERRLTGTVKQVILTDGGANADAVLSTPQDIDTACAFQCATLTASSLTSGRLPYVSTAGLIVDSSVLLANPANHVSTSGVETGLSITKTFAAVATSTGRARGVFGGVVISTAQTYSDATGHSAVSASMSITAAATVQQIVVVDVISSITAAATVASYISLIVRTPTVSGGGILTINYGVLVQGLAAFSDNGQTRTGIRIAAMPDPGAYTGTAVYGLHFAGTGGARDGICFRGAGNTELYADASASLYTNATFSASILKSYGTSNQIVLQSAGVTGTITWTPTSTNKTLTLPNATDTLVGKATTDTLTNKRITKRIQAVTSSATVTPNADNDDGVVITAQAAGLTLANPSGTPTQKQVMTIRIKDDGTARGINFGSQYRAIGCTLPTTTVLGKYLYMILLANTTDTKWDVLSVNQE